MISLNNLKYLSPHANTVDNSTHEYLNLQMVNEYTPNNTEPKLMIFNQTKTSNILDVSNDYYLSVIRWNIQCNLPVLIPDMVLYPPNTPYNGLTQYKICVVFTTSGGTEWNIPAGTISNILYVPEVKNPFLESILNAPTTKEMVLNDPYYYIRSVDSFLSMVNNAIEEFISSIAGANWTNPPFFNWDANANKIVLNRPNSAPTGIPNTDSTTRFYLAINQPLYNLLNTFTFNYYPPNVGNNNYPNIDCRYVLNTNNTPFTSGDYSPYFQQSSSVVNWSPVQSIVYVSSTIPVEAQFSGAPANLNNIDPSTQSNIYQQQSVVKVLTDFIVPFNSGVEITNSQVYYIPQSEYRLVDLLGNNALNQLTIQVFWRDKYGSFHPMTLDAGGSADILILLRKKSFNNQAIN
jgi:hypothetical protein